MSNAEISQLMVDGLARVLADFADAQTMDKIEKGETGLGHEKLIAELGFDVAMLPEDDGGAGLGWKDSVKIFELLGYYASPTDLGERIISQWASSNAGIEVNDNTPHVGLGTVESNTDGSVTGTILVPWASGPSLTLVEISKQDTQEICLIDTASAASIAPADTIGRVPSQKVVLENCAPIQIGTLDGSFGLTHAMAFLRSSQISGAMARILEMTIEYCNTRTQFGRPVGKFQAVQQLVAQLAGEMAAANAAVKLAAMGMDKGRGPLEIAIAKQRASAPVALVASIAHETHGAIGVTEEHILHYFTRRLWQWREEAGNEHFWAEEIGRQVVLGGGENLWPKLIGLTEG